MVNMSLLGLRIVKEASGRYDIERKISTPQDVYNIGIEILQMDKLAEEYVYMLSLNTKNVITGIFTISQGTLNSSLVHPREVYKRALLNNANSIILTHNHPSGDPTPSNEDIKITHQLMETGKILNIELLDHIVIGSGEYSSLKQLGFI
ncbi:MAG: DNA repair protein RadC [Tissierellaceae bacterium]|nr:DNA repair protein RadC [Tissierellaceae bacterium]